MWRLKDLIAMATSNATCINGKWVPARPLNFQRKYCSFWVRLRHAWRVIRGKEETFIWPEGQ